MPNAHRGIRNLYAPVECPSDIHNLNAQLEYLMSIWALQIWIFSWNSQCSSKHSKSECYDGMPIAYLSIRNLNAPVKCPMSILAFRNLNVQPECPMPIWAFEIWMLRWNVLWPSWRLKSECPGGMPYVHMININMMLSWNAQCPSAFEIGMLRCHAHCPSEYSKSECSVGKPNAHLSILNLNASVECPMSIWAFEIWMLICNAQCPS